MSQQARQELVNLLVFQRGTEKGDLLDPNRTQTQLIALLLDLAKTHGWHIEITAVRTDHHDDSSLGLHCHANGYAADCWPLKSAAPQDYLDAGDPRFQEILTRCGGLVVALSDRTRRYRVHVGQYGRGGKRRVPRLWTRSRPPRSERAVALSR